MGVARPRASGQAITTTVTARVKAKTRDSLAKKYQIMKVRAQKLWLPE